MQGSLHDFPTSEGRAHLWAEAGGTNRCLEEHSQRPKCQRVSRETGLNFIPKGVTIIYGDNGAGKSGYVRILKRSCRARNAKGKEDPLLPNIYDPTKGPQSAELEYHAGAQIQKATWQSGQSSDPLLSEISVFDSRTANVHVEETNDLAYTPFPMKVLERLVTACKAVKEAIDSEIEAKKAQTPRSIVVPLCSSDTAVGQMMATLGKHTKPADVEALATLSDDEAARLTVTGAESVAVRLERCGL